MTMKPVESSNVHSVGYDPERKLLHVRFLAKDKHSPGSLYEYPGISAAQHAAFVAAPSIGGHLHAHLRDNPAHPARKVAA